MEKFAIFICETEIKVFIVIIFMNMLDVMGIVAIFKGQDDLHFIII